MIADEITYTPGRLARKLGFSKTKLMKHLRATGLIEQCRLTQGGHWQIPYSVAARISSVEALSAPSPTPISRQRQTRKASPPLVNEPKPVSEFTNARSGLMVSIPNYAQIGKALRQAGVTMVDLIKYFEKQMEVTHEQYEQTQNPPIPPRGGTEGENNSAQRDENQAATKSTNGGGSSDISNSSAK